MGLFDSITSASDISALFKPGKNPDYGKDKGYKAYLEEQQKKKQSLINEGLNKGLTWEEIAVQTGVPTEQVQAYSQSTRPDYGIEKKKSLNPATALRDWATRDSQQQQATASLDASTQQIIKLLQDPNVDPKKKPVLLRYLAQQGIEAPQQAAANTQEIQARADPTNIPRALGSSFETVAKGLSRALPGGQADINAAQSGNQQLQIIQDQIIKLLKDPKIPADRKKVLLSYLNDSNRQTATEAAGLTQQVEGDTNKRKFAAAALDVALTPFALSPAGVTSAGKVYTTANGVEKAAELTGKARTIYNLAEATGYTGLGIAQGDSFTPKDIAINAATNFVPLGVGKIGQGFSTWLKDKKALQAAEATTQGINNRIDSTIGDLANAPLQTNASPITNPSRLLPDGTQSKAARIAEIDDKLNSIRTGETPNTSFKDNLPSGEGTTPTATTTPKAKAGEVPTINSFGRKIKLSPENGYEAVTAADGGKVYKKTSMTGSNIKGTREATTNYYASDGQKLNRAQFDAIVEGKLPSGTPDMRTQAAKRQGVTTVSNQTAVSTQGKEVRALVKEREKLVAEIDAIKNPEVKLAEASNLVDSELATAQKTGDKYAEKQATAAQDYIDTKAQALDNQAKAHDNVIEENIPLLTRVADSNAGESVPMATQRAIAEAKGQELKKMLNPETTANMNMEQQVLGASSIVNDDYQKAIRIAMGDENPPGDILASAVYELTLDKARKNKDFETYARLINESKVPSTGKAYGQYNAAFAARDPETSKTVLQDILKAKKNAAPGGKAVVTVEEVGKVNELTAKVEQTKARLIGMEPGSAEYKKAKQAYGDARVELDNYSKSVQQEYALGYRDTIKQKGLVPAIGKGLKSTFGISKGLVATLDNSALGRQGWPTLTTHPLIWQKQARKSFVDIYKTFKSAVKKDATAVLDTMASDAVSRPNALNNAYKDAKLAVYGAVPDFLEEAYPKTFKKLAESRAGRVALSPVEASEVAYTAFQQRNRVDLFDLLYERARKQGIDVTDKEFRKILGNRVNTLTRRGSFTEKAQKMDETLNLLFFSPKMFYSNFGLLGGHIITGGKGSKLAFDAGSNFIRKEAAKDLAKMSIAATGTLMALATFAGAEVETDTRSSDFGKVKHGNTRYDVTGGFGSFITLGSWLRGSSKSSTTGEVTKLNSGEYGGDTLASVLGRFAENKLSPLAGTALDVVQGKDFNGMKPTPQSIATSLLVPLSIRNAKDAAKSMHGADLLLSMISEGMGVSNNTYGLSGRWNVSNAKGIRGFKNSTNPKIFKKASDQFDTEFNQWYKTVSGNDGFWKLPQDTRLNIVKWKRNDLTEKVMARYGYQYKSEDKPSGLDSQIELFKKM